jgi:hypothetical protein
LFLTRDAFDRSAFAITPGCASLIQNKPQMSKM